MVAVRMVSEGVDIPRLAVGVYATSVSTALFFAQAVGRFVRVRQRGETASVFLPSIPLLLGYAAELEAERDHVLARRPPTTPRRRELAEAQRQRDTADELDDERRSRRWRRRRTSTGRCTTAASSAPRPRRMTSSACPGCWSRSRSACCCASARPTRPVLAPGRAAAARSRIRARALRCPRSPRTRRTRPPRRGPLSRASGAAGAPARVGQGEPGRAAQGAQLAGHGLASPDRPAARRHPRRAAPVLRRAAGAAGHRRPAPRADKRAAPVGVVPPLTTFVKDNSGTDPVAASRHHGDWPAARAHQVHRQ